MNESIENIKTAIESLNKKIINHKVYGAINNIDDLKVFMENHIFAVWDFMSLLKALQIQLTCVETPWTPSSNPVIRRLINEIVLAEESDIDCDGKPASHYELYIQAMTDANANTSVIGRLVDLIKRKVPVKEALGLIDASEAVKGFVNFTFSVIERNKPHEIAAAFTFGREDLIPDMFTAMVKELNNDLKLNRFQYYLDRHIELDGDEHGPMALKMINELCGDDAVKWQECISVSKESLNMRILLWDEIYNRIKMPQAIA